MSNPLHERITEAFHYAFAPHDLARARWQFTQSPNAVRSFPVNTFLHNRRLLNHRARVVTLPNNDTLYSVAWLDLSQGPIRLDVPAMGERYYSLAFMDVFTNNFACISRRTRGGAARTLWLCTPAQSEAAPAGAEVIRAPSDEVWLLGRVLVDGDQDLPNVHALQDGLILSARGAGPGYQTTPDEARASSFVTFVNEVLGRNRSALGDQEILQHLAEVGIRAGDQDAWSAMTSELQQAWAERYPVLRAELELGGLGGVISGTRWACGRDNIGQYGDDYAYRAQIALAALGALERAEAIYAITRDDGDGSPLDGAHRYSLTIPADLPINGFWSLSMYQIEADGRCFFVDNPLNRYTIGDRTPGIQKETDGSLILLLQHARPADDAIANWLPAPQGRFMVALRLYEPGPALLENRYALPEVTRVRGVD